MNNTTPNIPIDRRLAMAHKVTLPDRTQGAALFADISGFTPLTNMLVKELGRKQGAEALLNYINPVYESLITTLHNYGGSVINFAGDSITCWFDEKSPLPDQHTWPPATYRAVSCALAMQTAMQPFAIRYTPQGIAIELSIKVAVAAGPARRFVVGQANCPQIDVVAGATLTHMVAAEKQARAGEVIVTPLVTQQLAECLIIKQHRQGYAIVADLPVPAPHTPWPDIPPFTTTDTQDKPCSFPTIQTENQLSDLRPTIPLMLRFGGLDFDQDDQAGQKLNHYITWVQTVIHQYEGTLIQLIVGDKGAYFYVSFGAPVAHEDDNRRAIMAASTLQTPPPGMEWLQPVQIGLSQGEVWTGTVGANIRHTYGVVGRSVNLAARLMSYAQPGQILVSNHVYEPDTFAYHYIGDMAYKGFTRPVPTYELVSQKQVADRVFDSIMVGRDEELTQLTTFAQTRFAGHCAGVALIYGEPGIGKSRLVYALQKALMTQKSFSQYTKPYCLWLTGQSDSILPEAFNPFTYALKDYFGQTIVASEPENKANFEQRLQALLTDLSQITDTQHLQDELWRTRSLLGALLNLYWPNSLYEQLEAQERYQNTMTAISIWLQALCRCQPVVLELEDGHWLDEASHELLTALTRQTKQQPLLIVLTSRYADDGSRPEYTLTSDTSTLILELTTLTTKALANLAQTIVGTPIDPPLQHLLWTKSQANPFFAQQILYYLQENGWLQLETREGQHITHLATAANTLDLLPTTLNTLLVARLDRLTTSVKEVVQTAAVLGREFEQRLLAQILKRDITSEIAIAEQEQIWGALNTSQYIFKHELLREAAYGMQLRAHLQLLHYKAAIAAEKLYASQLPAYYETLAYHYETAYHLGQITAINKAKHYLQQAGQQALDNFENKQAATYFSRALNLTPSHEMAQRYTLHLARERAYDMQGKRNAQVEDLTQLVILAEQLSPLEQAQVALRHSRHAGKIGQYGPAIQYAKQSIDWGQQVGATNLIAAGYNQWGWILSRQGYNIAALEKYQIGKQYFTQVADEPQRVQTLKQKAAHMDHLMNEAWQLKNYTLAQHYVEQILLIQQEIGNRQEEGTSLYRLGLLASFRGDNPLAQRYYEQALIIWQEIGDRFSQSRSLNALGNLFILQRDYTTASDTYQQSLVIAREIGNRRKEGITLNNLGEVATHQGDYLSAQENYKQALAITREIGDRSNEGVVLNNLGTIYRLRGDYATAYNNFKQALTIARELTAWYERMPLNNLGFLMLLQANWQQAETYYKQALAVHQMRNQDHLLVETWSGLAHLNLIQGDWQKARQYSQQALAYVSDNPHLKGTENYMLTFQLIWQIWDTLGQTATAYYILTLAAQVMQTYLDKNSDPTIQAIYLSQPHHQVLWQVWQKTTRKSAEKPLLSPSGNLTIDQKQEVNDVKCGLILCQTLFSTSV